MRLTKPELAKRIARAANAGAIPDKYHAESPFIERIVEAIYEIEIEELQDDLAFLTWNGAS